MVDLYEYVYCMLNTEHVVRSILAGKKESRGQSPVGLGHRDVIDIVPDCTLTPDRVFAVIPTKTFSLVIVINWLRGYAYL